jgi:hypothetical protein
MKPKDYEAVIRGNVPPEWDNPYYFMFMAIITAFTSVEMIAFNDELIEFIVDTQQGADKRSKILYGQMTAHERFAKRIVAVSYCDDKKVLSLQAADLLAWQVRRAYCVTDEPRRPQFDAARNCIDKSFMTDITKDDLIRYLALAEARIALFEETTGLKVTPWQKARPVGKRNR